MKTYEDYMVSSPMTDGEEIRSFFDDDEEEEMKNRALYDAITDFATEYGSPKFNDADNIAAYNELVDKCIRAKKIPECNRYEYSTHSRLFAAITYYDNRLRFCAEESK